MKDTFIGTFRLWATAVNSSDIQERRKGPWTAQSLRIHYNNIGETQSKWKVWHGFPLANVNYWLYSIRVSLCSVHSNVLCQFEPCYELSLAMLKLLKAGMGTDFSEQRDRRTSFYSILPRYNLFIYNTIEYEMMISRCVAPLVKYHRSDI